MKRLYLVLCLIPVLFCILSVVLSTALTPEFLNSYCTKGLPSGSSSSHCDIGNFEGIQTRFIVLSAFFLGFAVFLFACRKDFIALVRSRHHWVSHIKTLFRRFLDDYHGNRLHYWFVLVIIFAGMLLRAFFMSVSMKTDEAATYVWYSSWPVYISQSLYTFPNNHLLNTLLVKVSTTIFGVSEVSIRLPAFLFGISCIVMVYILARKFFDRHTALLACALTSVSGYLVEYSFEARGYAIITFLALLSIYYANKVFYSESLVNWIILAFCLALSVYAVPIMLYFIIILAVWMLSVKRFDIFRKVFFRNAVIFSILLFFLISFLYYPVILLSGIKSIIANDTVKSFTISYVLSHYPSYMVEFVDALTLNIVFSYVWVVLSMGGIFLLDWLSLKEGCLRKFVLLFNVFIPVVIVLMFVQRVLPFVRSMIFIFPLFYILGAFSISYILKRISRRFFASMIIVLCLMVVIAGIFSFTHIYADTFDYLGDTQSASSLVVDNLQEGSCFLLSSERMKNTYEYYFTREGFNIWSCKKGGLYNTVFFIRNDVLGDSEQAKDLLDHYEGTILGEYRHNTVYRFEGSMMSIG